MKIVFTGGGTGGHFYPIIAVAEEVNKVIDSEKILSAKLYYVSDSPYDKQALFETGLIFEEVPAGKVRRYFSLKNFSDVFKTLAGMFVALYKIFSIYPDVVFGKGGYASFPSLLAARILRIPVVIHESDSAPGWVNKWAGHFAKRIAVSFKEAVTYFPEKKVAWTGQPVRADIERPADRAKAFEYFKFEEDLPVVLVLGGSQGAELINNTVLDALPEMLKTCHVIHQVGVKNFKSVLGQSEIVLANNPNKARYIPLSFLSPLQIKMAAGAATVIISRAGSTLFEIAAWGVPSILVPFTDSNADHSKKNAYLCARAGGCSVIDEMNMTGNILNSEVNRILGDKVITERMTESAKAFYKPGAANKIARELVDIALSHER